MVAALALAGLSAAGSLLGGIGAKQASAKQARLQSIQDAIAREANEKTLREVNAKRESLGRELLTVPEEHESSSESGNWVDVDGMMAAAERAGFNPVTWLNAGGMQAYQQAWTRSSTRSVGHNAADAFKLMTPDYSLAQASQVPQQHSMLSAFGGALTAGANAFGTQYRADQSYDVQMARLMAGTANQGMGLSTNNGLSTALSFGGGGVGGTGAVSSKSGAVSDLPYPANWKPGDVNVTNPGGRWFVDSTVADAEAYEARYGDVAQEVAGASNLFQDTIRAVTGKTLRDWGISAGMNIGDYATKSDNSYLGTVARWWNSPSSLPNRKLPGFGGSVEGYMPFPGANAY